MDHVHVAMILIIVPVIVHLGDHSNVYNPDWSNHSNFSWQAQAMRNCAPQFNELHHPEYLQLDTQSSHPSSFNQPAPQSSLEDTLKAFMHLTSQAISDMKNATVENTQAIARIEGQMKYLVAEVARIEEEELQGQLMADGHYMIDEEDSGNFIMSMSKPPPHLGVR